MDINRIPNELRLGFNPSYNINEFLDGMRDAKADVKHRAGMGASYDAGYGSQKELEAITSHKYARNV